MKPLLHNQISFNSIQRFIPVKIIVLLIALMVSLLSASYLNADTRYRVKPSDSVKRIIAKKYPNRSLSQEQIMIEIFFRNPKAFIKNDINRLKRGYRLRLPSEENIQAVSHSEAKSILKRGTKHYQSNVSSTTPSKSSDAASELLSEFELSGEDLELLGAGQGQLEKDIEVFVENNEASSQPEEVTQAVEPQAPVRSSQRVIQKERQRRNNRRAEKVVNKKELLSSRKKLSTAKKQLRIIEEERQNLKEQLDKLKKQKQISDAQLNDLDAKLQESIKLSAQLKTDLDVNLSDANDVVEPIKPEGESAVNGIISQDKKKRILEKQVQEKTQKLKDSNTFFQQKLQEARSELAENTRENIALERQLNALKNNTNTEAGVSKSTKTTSSDNLPTELSKEDGMNSVAGDIGVAKYSGKSLDEVSTSTNQGMDKWLWLFPILALFGGLWLLLRRFLGAKQTADSNESNTFVTTAFGSDDSFDEEYEEVSLETSIKLDVARAYIEADDQQSAREMLQEVIDEGNDEQQQEAKAILADYKLSA